MTPPSPNQEILGYALVMTPPVVLTLELYSTVGLTFLYFLGIAVFAFGLTLIYDTHNTKVVVEEVVAAP